MSKLHLIDKNTQKKIQIIEDICGCQLLWWQRYIVAIQLKYGKKLPNTREFNKMTSFQQSLYIQQKINKKSQKSHFQKLPADRYF